MLKAGDKVIFKTERGPVMMVTRINHPQAGSVECKWWDKKTREYKIANFNEEELELYEEEEEK